MLGVAALFALHALAPFTGVDPGVSPLSLGASAALGVPGVTLVVLFELL